MRDTMPRVILPNRHATLTQCETVFGDALRMRVAISRGQFPAGAEREARALHAALDRFIAAYESADTMETSR